MGSTPQHPGYEEMKDTPWITQGRDIADKGGKGILENYNKVNVFDDDTKRSLEARNNAVYKRAFDNMERQYTDIMNRYNAANYNQFGTLNATPAAYRTDMANLAAQRQMDDLAYNQAMNYENLINNELKRRYDTLNLMGNMYGYGSIPYQQDVANWNVRNKNADIAYENAKASHAGLGSLLGAGTGLATTALSYTPQLLGVFGNLGGSGSSSASLSPIGQAISNSAPSATSIASGTNLGSMSGSGSDLYNALFNATGGNSIMGASI